MRLLLDSNMSRLAVIQLRAWGHLVEYVPDLGPDPGDEKVLRYAFSSRAHLITADKGFGRRIVVEAQAHCGLIQLRGVLPSDQADAVRHVLEQHSHHLNAGAIVTVEGSRIRVRHARKS